MKATVNSIKSFIDELNETAKTKYLPYGIYAVRFDSRILKEGDFLGNSKSNAERAEDRDFPDYDTDEYNNLPSLNGTCGYYIYNGNREEKYDYLEEVLNMISKDDDDDKNWYIIASDTDCGGEEDPHEIVLSNAVVVKVL